MSVYIDIHSHKFPSFDEETITVRNVILPDEDIPATNYFSAGFHPWHAGKVKTEVIEEKLTTIANLNNCIAIGECGIDRSTEIPVELQIKEFKIHISVAEKSGKPIVIHCVRAYSDLMQVLKASKFSYPVILHNYNGNKFQTKQLLKYNCYFSFGEPLFLKNKTADIVQHIPANRIFLETDESNFSIGEMYSSAAIMLKMEEKELKSIVFENFKSLGIK
ncbi:MAG: TatD family hydrolase [Prolixibacteraceae bacterium]|nr:TatD family hydrolase [Prolixibacteraceae bacterium]